MPARFVICVCRDYAWSQRADPCKSAPPPCYAPVSNTVAMETLLVYQALRRLNVLLDVKWLYGREHYVFEVLLAGNETQILYYLFRIGTSICTAPRDEGALYNWDDLDSDSGGAEMLNLIWSLSHGCLSTNRLNVYPMSVTAERIHTMKDLFLTSLFAGLIGFLHNQFL